jgi:hypothetical protein
LPGKRAKRKVGQLNKQVAVGGPGSVGGRAPVARKQDWIGDQLRQVYDEALHDTIPEDMLELLNQLDDGREDTDS